MNRRGADDPANHDANDDRGRHHRRHGETANGQTLNNVVGAVRMIPRITMHEMIADAIADRETVEQLRAG